MASEVAPKFENKRKFEVELDGKQVKFEVVRPNSSQKTVGDQIYAKAVKEAIEAGAILRVRIKSLLRQQKMWDDQKEGEEQKLRSRLNELERELKRGGFKLSRGKVVALEIIDTRNKLRELTAEEIALDNLTAEAKGDDARFNYFVSACTVYGEGKDHGKTYFADYKSYLEKSEEDPVAGVAAFHLMSLLYGLDPDMEKKLPENAFLIKHGFKDKENYYVNKEGKRTDRDGRLIDEEGRYVDKDGKFIDRDGRPVDEKGEPVEEFLGYLDEEGNPLKEETPTVEPAVAA